MRAAYVAFPLLLLALLAGGQTAALAEDFEAGEIIVCLVPGAGIDAFNERWGTSTLDAYLDGNLYLLYAQGEDGVEDLADRMEQDPDVQWAEANYIQDTPEGLRMMVVNAVGGEFVDYEDQEIATRIGLDEAHTLSRGAGVRVAVLDTGADPTHEALVGHLVPDGFDFVGSDSEPWEEANGVDDDLDGLVDEGYAHGTMVSGIVALVAPEAEILPVRVLDDEGRADAFRIVEGIVYAMDHGAQILNCSFGASGTIESIDLVIREAVSRGIVVVAAAGNRALENPALFPAIQDDTYMITALDSLDWKADFADWNEQVRVSAPGTGVRSAYPGGDWGLGSGCSFAAPFVTGEVALIRSLWPDISPGRIEEHVTEGVQPIYDIPENEPYLEKLGTGRIYLPLALRDQGSSSTPLIAAASSGGVVVASPNPASGAVRFILPPSADQGKLRLVLFDPMGRFVRELGGAPGQPVWDGLDANGRPVASGRYFVRADAAGHAYRGSVQVLR